MERVHNEVYGPDGKWSSGDQMARPEGIKEMKVNGVTDLWPSWYDEKKNSGVAKENKTFNRYNHLLANGCTNDNYKIEIEVTKITDPISGKESIKVDAPYNAEKEDTCDYVPPSVSISTSGNKVYVSVTKGSQSISSYTLVVDGTPKNVTVSPSGEVAGYTLTQKEKVLAIQVTDAAGYTAVSEMKTGYVEPEPEKPTEPVMEPPVVVEPDDPSTTPEP
jgi:hypothetical protein